jgi:hypothetical protein
MLSEDNQIKLLKSKIYLCIYEKKEISEFEEALFNAKFLGGSNINPLL